MPAVIQPSFARGELAPSLYGRVDTAAYRVGLRTAFNAIIHDYGGVSNRPGLEFVGPVKNHTHALGDFTELPKDTQPVRLIPFRFKTTDTYMLEFGNLYMRVVRDDAHVTETAQNITNATQANPVVVTISGHGYSNGDEVTINGVVGMAELNGNRFTLAGVDANTFQLTSQVDGTTVDGTNFGAYTSGGTAAKIFEIVTPYAEADVATLKYAQSADVMTITHPSYDSRELSRADHDNWTLAVISFVPDQDHPSGITATQNGATGSTEYRYTVTAIADETFEESLAGLNNTAATITGATAANPVVVTAVAHGFLDGETVEINGVVGMTEINGRRFKVDNKTANDFELKGEDGTSHTAYTSGGTANLIFVKVTDGNATLSETDNIAISWSETAGAQRYAVYKEDNGLYGLLGETEELTYTDDGDFAPDLTSSPPRVREPFRGANNQPAAIGFHESRRVFGGSSNKPDTTDYSRTSDFSNFTVSTPAKADDAIRATLTSGEINEILHYVSLDDLIIFTSGEEWRVDTGENNRFSIDTMRQKAQTQWGSSHRRPAISGRVILFVQENGSVVRSIGYELAVDGYTGTDMSLLGSHIFRDHIISDWGYAKTPDKLFHLVRADGQAATLTFNQAQEVIAWARWATRTPDKFESVAVVRPSATAVDDSAYFVVKRTVNGQTVRYIEKTHSRRFTDVQDCFFVDSGLTFDSPIAISTVALTNPVTVTTTTAHSLVTGDEVDVSDIVWVPDVDEFDGEAQPAQLNNGRFQVRTVPSSTQIVLETLDGKTVDATGFNAYVENGNVRKAVTTLSGFHHLANEDVIALANGNVVRGLTVSATGQVTLPRKFSRVHVGLGYFSDVELLNIEATGAGTLQGRLKNVHEVTARLDRSRGLWAGPDANNLTELKQRKNEPYGEPTELFTGDVEITILPSWNSNGRVYFRQRDPLPMTLLAAIPRFELEQVEEDGEK